MSVFAVMVEFATVTSVSPAGRVAVPAVAFEFVKLFSWPLSEAVCVCVGAATTNPWAVTSLNFA